MWSQAFHADVRAAELSLTQLPWEQLNALPQYPNSCHYCLSRKQQTYGHSMSAVLPLYHFRAPSTHCTCRAPFLHSPACAPPLLVALNAVLSANFFRAPSTRSLCRDSVR